MDKKSAFKEINGTLIDENQTTSYLMLGDFGPEDVKSDTEGGEGE